VQNAGTVSNDQGNYKLSIDPQPDGDTLKSSCTGYTPFSIKVRDFRYLEIHDIALEEPIVELPEVAVRTKQSRYTTLVRPQIPKRSVAVFKRKEPGYACGVLMK